MRTFSQDELDAYMREGRVPADLECPILLSPLRNPVRSSQRAPAYINVALREWFRHSPSRRDPLTQEVMGAESLRQDAGRARALERLRLAAERTWLAAGDRERAWATRWLRLYCRRLETRPLPALPPLPSGAPMSVEQVVQGFRDVRQRLFPQMLAMAQPGLRNINAAQDLFAYALYGAVAARGAAQWALVGFSSSPAAAMSVLLAGRIGVAAGEACIHPRGDRGQQLRAYMMAIVGIVAIYAWQLVPPLPSSMVLLPGTLYVFGCLAGLSLGLENGRLMQLQAALARLRDGA